MNYPDLNEIIRDITKDERFFLFEILDKRLKGNYLEKAKAIKVGQSAYYQYKNKELALSNRQTMIVLNILKETDLEAFFDFIRSIILKSKERISTAGERVSIIEECINVGFVTAGSNIIARLLDTYNRYDTFCTDHKEKQAKLNKEERKKKPRKKKEKIISDMYGQLCSELNDPHGIGQSFVHNDPKDWNSDYYHLKKLASMVGFVDSSIKLTKVGRPNEKWFEHLVERWRETDWQKTLEAFIGDPDAAMIEDIESKEELEKYNNEEMAFKEKLRNEFNKIEKRDITKEEFDILLENLRGLFPSEIKNLAGQPNTQSCYFSPIEKIRKIKEILNRKPQGPRVLSLVS